MNINQSSISELKQNIPKYGEKIILGKKLENPYSIENMQKALNNSTEQYLDELFSNWTN